MKSLGTCFLSIHFYLFFAVTLLYRYYPCPYYTDEVTEAKESKQFVKGVVVIDALSQGLANYVTGCLFLTGLQVQNVFLHFVIVEKNLKKNNFVTHENC